MWKIFFKYSDNSSLILTGKTKEISDRLIEKYYRDYGRNAASAIYQKYPKKSHPARDFLAMYQSLHMEPCPICGTKSCVVQYISREGKSSYHVCCGNPPEGAYSCELFGGLEDGETGKVKWFDSEMDAINYWNNRTRGTERGNE